MVDSSLIMLFFLVKASHEPFLIDSTIILLFLSVRFHYDKREGKNGQGGRER
ncbi:hypothetical protein ACWNXI_07755 [Caldibacillus thermoamylovorans]